MPTKGFYFLKSLRSTPKYYPEPEGAWERELIPFGHSGRSYLQSGLAPVQNEARHFIRAEAASRLDFTEASGRRKKPMKRTWTIIGVADVAVSFKWYQSLFGQPETLPAHDYFGQIVDPDGTVLLCLHAWGAHDHPSLMSPEHASPGNGLLLFFRVDDFSETLRRAHTLAARLEEQPHLNPNTETMEFSLRDPDGYYVTVSALPAS